MEKLQLKHAQAITSTTVIPSLPAASVATQTCPSDNRFLDCLPYLPQKVATQTCPSDNASNKETWR